jgi:hypothetical protein
MFDLMLPADAIKDVLEGIDVPIVIVEPDAIIHCPAVMCLQPMRGPRLHRREALSLQWVLRLSQGSGTYSD